MFMFFFFFLSLPLFAVVFLCLCSGDQLNGIIYVKMSANSMCATFHIPSEALTNYRMSHVYVSFFACGVPRQQHEKTNHLHRFACSSLWYRLWYSLTHKSRLIYEKSALFFIEIIAPALCVYNWKDSVRTAIKMEIGQFHGETHECCF